MLTKKIVSGSLALALTASVAMLAGCPGPTTPTDPSASASASADPSASASASSTASASPSASATSTASASPSASGSASPSPSQSSTIDTRPSGDIGTTPDIATRATFNGKVFDASGTPVDAATVSAKSVDPNVNWVGESQATINGAYVFRNAPVGARIEIMATKAGWTTKVRTEVIKSNLQGDSAANTFDFDGIFTIQDEPMVESVKVNGTLVNKSGAASTATPNANQAAVNAINLTNNIFTDSQLEMLRPENNNGTAISGVDSSDLTVEMTFSEAVDKETVQNNFRIFSEFHHNNPIQNNRVQLDGAFEIDERNPTTTWSWSADGKVATFKTNKAILTTEDGNEMRYTATFVRTFEDSTDKAALKRNAPGTNKGGYFKFSETSAEDFFTFSVKKDEEDPKLNSLSATDNNGSDDLVVLNFSKAMDVINYRAYGVDLSPLTSNAGVAIPVGDRLKMKHVNLAGAAGALNTPGATQLYFTAGGVDQIVYSVTRLDVDGKNPKSLNVNAITSAKLDSTGKKLTLTFNNAAFDRNERILVRVGNQFDGNVGVSASGTNANLKDAAGNPFSTSNSTTTGNVTINDSQKVVTAGG